MKKLLFVFLIIILFFCATPALSEPFNIPVAEVEELIPLHSLLVNPFLTMNILKHEKVIIIAQEWIGNRMILRYCYLDQGVVVGFALNTGLYNLSKKKLYSVDKITDLESIWIKKLLDRVARGVEKPFDEDGN